MLYVRQRRQLRRFGAVCLIAAIACTASREGSGGRDARLPTSSLITIDRELYRVRRTAGAIEIDIVTPVTSRMSDPVRLRAMLAPNAMPRFETEPIAGSYRVVYTQAHRAPNEGPGGLLSLEQRVSNTFRNQE
jgi:hypothetical protein